MDVCGIGVITEVNDDFSIKFRIPGVAEDCIAYPMWGESEPEEDHNIIWFRLDPRGLGESFIYKKLDLSGTIELKVGDYHININKDKGILLEKSEGAKIELKDDKVIVNDGNNNGAVNIDSITKIINWITALNGVFSSAPSISEPGNGLPSVFAAACLSATSTLTLPTAVEAEDKNFTH